MPPVPLLCAAEHHALGQACALITAISWGYAVVLFKQSGDNAIPPLALNLFKNAVGLVLLVLTLLALVAWQADAQRTLFALPLDQVGLLLLSGIIGIAIADTMFFYALNLIGVGLISIVDCSYTPFMILFSWWLLQEKLTVLHYIGAALVVGGVFIATEHAPPVARTHRQIVTGVLLATVAIALMALGIVMVKPSLEPAGVAGLGERLTALIWATTLRLAAGFAALALFTIFVAERAKCWSVFQPRPGWRYALPGAVLGTYFSLVLWVAGIAYTYVAVAAALNQTSVIVSCILAAVILKERFGGRQIAALLLAMLGALTVIVADPVIAWISRSGAVEVAG